MKEFYAKANSLLKIKRSNPVVTKVQREDENGDTQIFEDKTLVEGEIANYFSGIYKRPDYRRQEFRSIDFNVEDDDDMRIDTNSSMSVSPFTKEEVCEASKSSNFKKGMGPDCFDGNMLKLGVRLNDKVMLEIIDALNDMRSLST